MRLALFGSAALVLVNATLFACSSSPPPAADPGEDSQSQSAMPSSTAAPTEPPPSTTPTPAPTDPDASAVVVPGATGTVPPTGSDPGTACLPDSIKEAEGNNDPGAANTIPTQTATFCGRLEAGDVDHVQFIMPQTMRQFSYRPEVGFGTFVIEATAGGQPFDPDGFWPFAGGQPYVFKISSPGNQRPVDYRLRFEFTP